MPLKIAQQPYNFHSHTAYDRGIESCRFLTLHHVASYSDLSSSRSLPFLSIVVPRKKRYLPIIFNFKRKRQRTIILEQTLRYAPTFPGTISFLWLFLTFLFGLLYYLWVVTSFLDLSSFLMFEPHREEQGVLQNALVWNADVLRSLTLKECHSGLLSFSTSPHRHQGHIKYHRIVNN